MALASKFRYKPRDPEVWEKRANQQGGDFIGVIKDDYKQFAPAKGDNYVRILPPTWEDAEHYGLDIYVHYGIGPDRGSALCLNKMKNAKCPICEAKQKADRAGNKELSDELGWTRRVLVWMIDRKDESKGPMIWSMPQSLDRDFVKNSRDRTTGEIYAIDDPENGYDVSFEKTGEQLNTRYLAPQLARRPSSVDQDYIDYIVAEPLPECLVWMTYAEIKSLYEGGADSDESDQKDADEKEPLRNPGARTSTTPRERERETRDPPPTQEEEKPRWKPRGKAAQPPSEEEQQEAAAEQEEAPEPPRKPAERPAQRRADPEPEPETRASAKSRADELRAKFGNRR